MGVGVEYRCLDGSPFPVTFIDQRDAGLTWVLDREHAPTAMTPLAEAVRREGHAGLERAYAESDVPVPSTLVPAPPFANGYDYAIRAALPPAERAEFRACLARLAERNGWTRGVWRHHALPRVREACARLWDAPPDTPYRTLAEWRSYAWSHTGIAGVVARHDAEAVAAVLQPLVGDRATLVSYELAQGWDSETTTADLALWQLTRPAPESAAGRAAREEFISSYGSRAVSWPIDQPTMRERPEVLEAQLRLLARHRGLDPVALRAGARERRRTLVAEIGSRFGDDDQRARFERRVARLEAFVPVREDRAHWQLIASAAMRAAVRRRGSQLVERGVLAETDDVFFLTPDEYDQPSGDLRAAVTVRRTEHAHWRAVVPPAVIGATDAESGVTTGRPNDDGVLRGVSAAGGRVHGTARVILDLAESERLRPGDVLVTTMTAPPWTPLFGIAAAVVTDAGDALSHAAIAAREYGIPCVVGTHLATTLVADGSTVTVDGDAGIVVLRGRAVPHTIVVV